jgi:hypothetical protein
MPAKRKMPSDSILERWVDEGLDHHQIQDRIKRETGEDVALSSVSGHLSRIGLTNRVRYDEFIPWGRISVDHNHAFQLTMLRIGARLQAGKEVRPVDRTRYENWVAKLQQAGAVVHYEYHSPDGFYYVKARPKIDTGLVRVPDKPKNNSS